MEDPVLHTILTSDLTGERERNICQSGGRSGDLPTFQADRFTTCISPLPAQIAPTGSTPITKRDLKQKCLSAKKRK